MHKGFLLSAIVSVVLVGGGYLAGPYLTFVTEHQAAVQKELALLEAENKKVEARIAQQERELASPQHIMTADGAILCVLPSNLAEAHSAANAQDPKWLKDPGCITAKGGMDGMA
jgi:hypothetical protein